MFEKTDNVVVIIPEKYGEMYGIYLSTLAAWTGKGNAYMVYNYDTRGTATAPFCFKTSFKIGAKNT